MLFALFGSDLRVEIRTCCTATAHREWPSPCTLSAHPSGREGAPRGKAGASHLPGGTPCCPESSAALLSPRAFDVGAQCMDRQSVSIPRGVRPRGNPPGRLLTHPQSDSQLIRRTEGARQYEMGAMPRPLISVVSQRLWALAAGTSMSAACPLVQCAYMRAWPRPLTFEMPTSEAPTPFHAWSLP